MESSSSDLFDQFLKTGMGAKPLIAGYENQLLEFAVENPDTWEQIKGDIVIMYPTPTVWSSHVYIALDEAGTAGTDALLDEDIQRLAWEKHGFRTGVYDTPTDAAHYTPHMFRHSFATYLWEQCGNIYEVKEILGHSSVKTTERYVHASFEQQKRILTTMHPRNTLKIEF